MSCFNCGNLQLVFDTTLVRIRFRGVKWLKCSVVVFKIYIFLLILINLQFRYFNSHITPYTHLSSVPSVLKHRQVNILHMPMITRVGMMTGSRTTTLKTKYIIYCLIDELFLKYMIYWSIIFFCAVTLLFY